MVEKVSKLIPSAKEKPKPEKPADIVSNEEFEKNRRDIALKREEEEAAKSSGQRKGETRQRFIEKIEESRKQFEKLKEDNQ